MVGEWVFGRNRPATSRWRKPPAAGSAFEAAAVRIGWRQVSSCASAASSSARIRPADKLLGSLYTATVSCGRRPGHGRISTVNLLVPSETRAVSRRHAARAHHDGRDYRAAVSIGDKPTFGGTESVVEVHLIDFARSIYGEFVSVRDWRFLREQKWFATRGELAAAIARDVDAVAKAT